MSQKRAFSILILIAFSLSACISGKSPTPMPTIGFATSTAPAQPTALSPTQTSAPTATTPPTAVPATATVPPTATTVPPTATLIPPTATTPPTAIPPTATTAPSGSGLPDISSANYLDDRSTPAAIMLSYFNAINRQEYLRAYSYYGDPTQLGTLQQFTNGYANTKSVTVTVGDISSGGAAGTIYFTVPMVLHALTTADVKQKFAACYRVRWPEPGNFGVPPIIPMNIDISTAKSVPLSTTNAEALATACPEPDFPTMPNPLPPAVESLHDLSAANYIDNRSDAVALMSSFVNAINRKEYVRAYSYWETPPGAYTAFANGYATTASVKEKFGTVKSDAGAGQFYYSIPVALKATQTDNSLKTYVGCYVLHISNPSIQGVPPFLPLGIKSADVKEVANNSDLDTLLQTACP